MAGLKKVKNLVATMGKYTDTYGNEKSRYITVGSMFERQDGSVCLKLDAIPIGEEFTGWVNCYEPREREEPSGEPHDKSVAEDALKDDHIPF
tara:strand:+ start:3944 stop:4219 length:276 start_codon:yes stop_codon:yes gene_type:complete